MARIASTVRQRRSSAATAKGLKVAGCLFSVLCLQNIAHVPAIRPRCVLGTRERRGTLAQHRSTAPCSCSSTAPAEAKHPPKSSV